MGNAMPFCAKWKVCRAAWVKMVVWEAPECFLRAWMVEEAFGSMYCLAGMPV